jgi:1,4-dihydroxy-2-naphthoyl-CoA hydrolase
MEHADTSRPVWHGSWTLDQLHALTRGTLVEHLGIEFCSLGENFLRARLPVRAQTAQRLGFLHGGASLALVETVGSLSSQMCVAPEFVSLGLEINANHVRTVRQGQVVEATSSPIHLGRQTHIWSVRVEDEEGKLVCVARLTTAVQPRTS